jgi:hypothetical protein
VAKQQTLLFVFLTIGIFASQALALEDLSGSIRLGSMVSRVDTNGIRSFDQQYMLNYSRMLLPYTQIRVSLRYRDFQSRQERAENGWHGELQPSGDIRWKNPFFATGGHYDYRQTRDFIATNNLTSRSAGAFFQTRFVNLPVTTARYEWQKQSYNLLLLPQSTEERRIQADTRYDVRNLSLLYSFMQREFENHFTDVSQNYQQHIFRTDYSKAFVDGRVRFSGSYLFNYDRYQQETGITPEPYTRITTVLGLYAEDSSPEFGALESVPTLIDGNISDPTSPQINIGGASVDQNIGFDLGISRSVSVIYIYTDSPSDPDLQWTIFASEDNQLWSEVPSELVSTFNLPERRYEIAFEPVESRYFKAVNIGINQEPSVLVTEIQALTSSQNVENGPEITQNHNLTLNTSIKASEKLSFGFDVLAGRTPETESREGREDLSVAGSVSYRPVDIVSSVVRYQHENIDYTNSLIGSRGTRLLSASISVTPIETIGASLSGSRTTSLEEDDTYQRITSGLFRVSTQWLPRLTTSEEAGYIHDERIQEDAVIDSWRYRLSADIKLLEDLSLLTNYSFQTYSSNQLYQIKNRSAIELQFTYLITPSIFLRGAGKLNREGDREDTSQNYVLSWNLTQRISASSSLRITDSNSENGIVALTAQNTYILSNRTSVNLIYSYGSVSVPNTITTSSFRVDFSTSF